MFSEITFQIKKLNVTIGNLHGWQTTYKKSLKETCKADKTFLQKWSEED